MLIDKSIIDEKYLQTTALIGVITFLSFGILDYFIFKNRDLLLTIRLFYISPFMLFFLILLFLTKKTETKVLLYCLIIQLAAANIIIFIHVLHEYNQLYYTGLVFLILFVTNITGLPVKINLLNVILIFAGFFISLLLNPVLDKIIFINDIFGLLFVSAVGLFANSQMDKYKILNYQVKLKQKEKISQLAHKSLHDKLTGLKNRYAFEENFKREWNSSLRNKLHLSLLMVDIDDFKKFNDNYGHMEGDNILKKVAFILQKVVKRTNDLVVRFGGEEFLILLHNADRTGAEKVAKNILAEIRNERIKHEYSTSGILTVSIGCCTIIPSSSDSPDEIINKADKALYFAKQQGKNRYEFYEGETETKS